jgi:hypothetical protein
VFSRDCLRKLLRLGHRGGEGREYREELEDRSEGMDLNMDRDMDRGMESICISDFRLVEEDRGSGC